MARKLDSFPAASEARYPWEQWLDGDPWELERGADFHAKPNTIRANAQIQAKKRGGRARTRHLKADNGREVVIVQFVAGARP